MQVLGASLAFNVCLRREPVHARPKRQVASTRRHVPRKMEMALPCCCFLQASGSTSKRLLAASRQQQQISPGEGDVVGDPTGFMRHNESTRTEQLRARGSAISALPSLPGAAPKELWRQNLILDARHCKTALCSSNETETSAHRMNATIVAPARSRQPDRRVAWTQPTPKHTSAKPKCPAKTCPVMKPTACP